MASTRSTAAIFSPQEATKDAVLAAIEVGFRNLDTAYLYRTEKPLGEGVAEAVRRGLVESRLPGGGVHHVQAVVHAVPPGPDLTSSSPHSGKPCRNLQMEYIDLYLIHQPISLPFDFKGVWQAMEECQRLGLARAIGVSNFTTKHLDRTLASATITPAVNQQVDRGLPAAEAEEVLRRQGHPRPGVLAVGWEGRAGPGHPTPCSNPRCSRRSPRQEGKRSHRCH